MLKDFHVIIIIVICIEFLQFYGLSILGKWERRDVQIMRRKDFSATSSSNDLCYCKIFFWSEAPDSREGLDKCRGQRDIGDCVRKYTFALEEQENIFKKSNVLEATAVIKCSFLERKN